LGIGDWLASWDAADGWMDALSLSAEARAHALITNPQIEVSKFVPENSIFIVVVCIECKKLPIQVLMQT
jgi:hypothetical protein